MCIYLYSMQITYTLTLPPIQENIYNLLQAKDSTFSKEILLFKTETITKYKPCRIITIAITTLATYTKKTLAKLTQIFLDHKTLVKRRVAVLQ